VNPKRPTLDDLLDAYFSLRDDVHAAFSYREDWRAIPLDDCRGIAWMLVGGEGAGGRVVQATEPSLPLTLELIREGSRVSSAAIYTQRFLPKWVYRTPTHVLACVDTRTDGNKFLQVFSAKLECTDEALRAAWTQRWGTWDL